MMRLTTREGDRFRIFNNQIPIRRRNMSFVVCFGKLGISADGSF